MGLFSSIFKSRQVPQPQPKVFTEAEVKDLVSAAQSRQAERMRAQMATGGHRENPEYRPLLQRTIRDMLDADHSLMIKTAYEMYDKSPTFARLAEDAANFVLGEGVKFNVTVANESTDPNEPEYIQDAEAYEVLEAFWQDSINELDQQIENYVEFLGVLGEQCYAVFVAPNTGKVRLRYIDPQNIKDVLPDTYYPQVPAQVQLLGTGDRPGKKLSCIRQELNPMDKNFGKLVGECFFFSINKPPNATRGRSDLLALMDFIAAYEEAIYTGIERDAAAKTVLHDVTLAGATEEEIINYQTANAHPPRPGSVRVHNESVEWKVLAPNMNHADASTLDSMMRKFIAMGRNIPESWLGTGGKAYQNEAEMMAEPTFKALAKRQRYVKNMILKLLQFQVDQAVIAGALPEKERFIEVTLQESSQKDMLATSNMTVQLAQALSAAQMQGWIYPADAAQVFTGVLSRFGIGDIEPAQDDPDYSRAGEPDLSLVEPIKKAGNE